MKKLITALFILMLSYSMQAQVKISGKVDSLSAKSVQVNLLYGSWYSQFGRFNIVVHADGTFSNTFNISYPIFADIFYNQHHAYVLLVPKRNLQVFFNNDSIRFSGDAGPENKLLYQIGLREQKFFESYWEENKYVKMSADSIDKLVIKKFFDDYDEKREIIKGYNIPAGIKKIIMDETMYGYQSKLYDFAQNRLRWAGNGYSKELSGKILKMFTMPNAKQIRYNFFANMMLEYYIESAIPKSRDSVVAIEKLFHAKVDILIRKVEQLGERSILNWLYAKYNLSKEYGEKILLNIIIDSYDQYDFGVCKMFTDSLKLYFPKSNYFLAANSILKNIEDSLKESTQLNGISFHNTEGVKSLKDIIKNYNGKVVYLDIWGTWCGPCINEIKFGVPNLKNRMKGEDVIFVYLDKDEEEKDKKWKDFVMFHKLTGEHYRMTQNQIQAIWQELRKDAIQSYPTFVIFDKRGNLINNDAARPTEIEEAVSQLKAAIKL